MQSRLGTNRTQIQFDFDILWLTSVEQNGSAGVMHQMTLFLVHHLSSLFQVTHCSVKVTLSLSSLSCVVVASHACVAQITPLDFNCFIDHMNQNRLTYILLFML